MNRAASGLKIGLFSHPIKDRKNHTGSGSESGHKRGTHMIWWSPKWIWKQNSC